MKKAKILIVGGGPAGIAAAKAASKHCKDVLICGAEPHNPYWRTRLPSVIAEKTNIEKLNIVKDNWFENNDVGYVAGKVMQQIDTKNNIVIWQDGSQTQYEKLILATGANCFVPDINTNEQLLTLRYYEDAYKIREQALKKQKAVVIGGGLLGLEIAHEIKKLNVPVTVVELDEYLLAKQLDKAGAEFLKNKLEDDLLTILTNTNINDKPELLQGACVVVAAGIRSNIKPIEESNIKTRGSVVVDEFMKTSVNNIYACGDVAEYLGRCYGLVSVANMQGTVAGNNAAGVNSKYTEMLQPSMLKINKVSLMTIGSISERQFDELIKSVSQDKYHAFAIKNNLIVGAAFIGDTSIGFKTKAFIDKEIKVKSDMSYEELTQYIKEYK